jgi:hypothetical protein
MVKVRKPVWVKGKRLGVKKNVTLTSKPNRPLNPYPIAKTNKYQNRNI